MRNATAFTSLAVAIVVAVASTSSSTPTPVTRTAPPAIASPDLAAMLGEDASSARVEATNIVPAFFGNDENNASNTFVQPVDPAESGGGRDQTQQFFDLVIGDLAQPSVVVGLLGADILVGGASSDFIVGGPEHFNPQNRDKAFGGFGDDVFMWAPGDGSDRFDGGPGLDTVIFGLIAEEDANGNAVFKVSNDQKAGNVFLDGVGIPIIDVTNSPGFCEIADASLSATAAAELHRLDVTHLVQFIIRGVNDAFRNGTQRTDNGVRVTLHLRNVEFVVCATRAGGQIEAFDLRTSPPTPIPLSSLPAGAQYVTQ